MPSLPRLDSRVRLPELMDDPSLDEGRHRQALRGLSMLNRLTRIARLLWPPLAELSRQLGRPPRVLDVATGAGDIPLALLRIARRHGATVNLSGCDISPRAIEFARRQSDPAGAAIDFFQCDVLNDKLPGGYDAVVCTLFLHHLSDSEAAQLMRQMAMAAGRLVVVCDLARSRVGWWLTYAGTRLLTRSPVVHVDGPLSMQAAFTVEEIRSLAVQAGLMDCTIRRRMPFRFVLSWWRDENNHPALRTDERTD